MTYTWLIITIDCKSCNSTYIVSSSIFLITNNIAMSRSMQIVLFSFQVKIELEVHSRKSN